MPDTLVKSPAWPCNASVLTCGSFPASKLYEGEEFYLQIDSHSHFAPNWDTSLMAQIDRLPDPHRGILSHYPPPDDTDMNNADSIDW